MPVAGVGQRAHEWPDQRHAEGGEGRQQANLKTIEAKMPVVEGSKRNEGTDGGVVPEIRPRHGQRNTGKQGHQHAAPVDGAIQAGGRAGECRHCATVHGMRPADRDRRREADAARLAKTPPGLRRPTCTDSPGRGHILMVRSRARLWVSAEAHVVGGAAGWIFCLAYC
jgi:hypothetical protein